MLEAAKKKEGKQDTAHITGQMDILSHKQSVTLAGSLLSSHSLQTKLLSALLHWSDFLPTRSRSVLRLGDSEASKHCSVLETLIFIYATIDFFSFSSLCCFPVCLWLRWVWIKWGHHPPLHHSCVQPLRLLFSPRGSIFIRGSLNSFCTHTNPLMHSDSCISFCTVVSSYCQTER